MNNTISCPGCNKQLKQITNTHIKKFHPEFSSVSDFLTFYKVENSFADGIVSKMVKTRTGQKRNSYDWSSGKHQNFIKNRNISGENHWNFGKITPLKTKINISNGVRKTKEHCLNTNNKINYNIIEDDKKRYKIYCRKVDSFTKYWFRIYKSILDPQNLRNKNSKNRHELDHMFSKYYGFKNNIPPYIIGHFSNLILIPYETNKIKSHKCSITSEILFERYFYTTKNKTEILFDFIPEFELFDFTSINLPKIENFLDSNFNTFFT